MKKVLVLMLVLAMTQLTWAGIATLQVNSADAKSDYSPSDTITVEIVYDFSCGGMSADSVNAELGTLGSGVSAGEAMSVAFNSGFDDLQGSGTIVNSGGVAVSGLALSASATSPDVEAGQVLWSMEFHIPDLPASSIIVLSTTNFFASPADFSDMVFETNSLELHVIPEPITIALLGLGGLFIRRK